MERVRAQRPHEEPEREAEPEESLHLQMLAHDPAAEPESEAALRPALPVLPSRHLTLGEFVGKARLIWNTLQLCGHPATRCQTLADLAYLAVESWRRLVWLERWRTVLHFRRPALRQLQQLEGNLVDLGCMRQRLPSQNWYDYVLVGGGNVPGMQLKFAFVDWLSRSLHLEWRQLVVLCGARPLDPEVDTCLAADATEEWWQLPWCLPRCGLQTCSMEGGAQTEADVAVRLLQRYTWGRKRSAVVVECPMQYQQAGLRRPGRKDVVRQWLATRPEAGDALLVELQPHLLRMGAEVRELLRPHDIAVDVCGVGLREASLNMWMMSGAKYDVLAVALDALAHWCEVEVRHII